MNIKEEISSIVLPAESKFKERSSLFIGKAFPVENENEFALEFSVIKKNYYDATHLCYAFKLKDDSFKYSDAGEPNGTAGIRIYNAIEHFSLVDVGVVVIRYFGGTKLGIGPLGKAYFRSAEDVLSSAEKVIKKPFKEIIIKTGFEFISTIHHYLPQFNAVIKNVEYSNTVLFSIEINPSAIINLCKLLNEASRGNIEISESDGVVYKTLR